ncbi:hypothetical protein C8R43DRAFT_1139470 [Mycena crocata]|nr:hypothetical protein C8R43DRAFT_1139470 [Mycena crocata]
MRFCTHTAIIWTATLSTSTVHASNRIALAGFRHAPAGECTTVNTSTVTEVHRLTILERLSPCPGSQSCHPTITSMSREFNLATQRVSGPAARRCSVNNLSAQTHSLFRLITTHTLLPLSRHSWLYCNIVHIARLHPSRIPRLPVADPQSRVLHCGSHIVLAVLLWFGLVLVHLEQYGHWLPRPPVFPPRYAAINAACSNVITFVDKVEDMMRLEDTTVSAETRSGDSTHRRFSKSETLAQQAGLSDFACINRATGIA